MLKIEINENEQFLKNSDIIKTSTGKTYQISTRYVGKKGEEHIGYFGVILLDESGKEISRKIKWLNDFSGQQRNSEIIFKSITDKILLIYRINCETPVNSNCSFELVPLEEIILEEIDSHEESFDEISNYVEPKRKELSLEEEEYLEKNLVWIFGSSRSGTSWLGLELLSFQTKSINELHITEHLGTPHAGILDLDINRWVDACKNLDGYFFSDKYKKTWIHYLRKLILNRIYAQIENLDKKIILKEPSVMGGADIISECLPKSKIIFLFRDGRDVLDSIIDANKKDGFMTLSRETPPVTLENREKFIETRAKLWVHLIENLLHVHQNHSDELKIIIKYEDLLSKTKEILKKIYDFLEIEINDEELKNIISKFDFENIPKEKKGSGKFFRSAAPGKWKENFNQKEKNLIEKIMGNTLKKIGYD